MPLIVDGIEPTAIEIDGDSNIKTLKVDGVNYWGKPYTLTYTVGTGATLTVTRTSSQSQNAPTGVVLENGSLIYHNDYIQFSITTLENYEVTKILLNGVSTHIPSFTGRTVTENMDIVIETNQLAEWQTVWSGSQSYYSKSTITNHTMTVPGITSFSSYSQVRITGTTYNDKTSFSVISKKGSSSFPSVTVVDNGKNQRITPNASGRTLSISTQGSSVFFNGGLTITKIEVI